MSQKLPDIVSKAPTISSVEKVEGNMVNTYNFVIKGDTPQEPERQVTVVQNTETKEVKIVDVEEYQKPAFVAPAPKKVTSLPEI